MIYRGHSIPAAPTPALQRFSVGAFLGADLTDAAANVAEGRSPYCPNMVRESIGKVRKRTGWHAVGQYPARINGVHFFADGGVRRRLVHAGTVLYLAEEDGTDTVLRSDLRDDRSVARQLGDTLCLLDGGQFLLIRSDGADSLRAQPAREAAYLPTVLIARSPNGGGVVYESVNLLGSGRTEQFLGTAQDTVYQLSAAGLDSTPVTVRKMTADGSFAALAEGKDFTVDRTAGRVIFSTAPGVSPVTGEDNVMITYHKTVPGYAGRIDRCRVMTAYGVNGARDRLFVAGDPQAPNRDHYSALNDPTYFGDDHYALLGQENAAIMGYSVVNDLLATHKDHEDDDTNIFLRSGTLLDGEAAFPLAGSYQGSGAVSRWAFGVLGTEPLFVTEGDIMAVTPSDVLGERYAQGRGYYLRGALQGKDLSEAPAIVWQQFYVLAVGDDLLLLDGAQAVYEHNAPYATRQYECWYWTGIGARVLYLQDGALCFGREDGRLCRFYTDYGEIGHFCDDGAAIEAAWKTPELFGSRFDFCKDWCRIAVLLGAAAATGCRIWAYYDGKRELLRDYDSAARYFSYAQLGYGKFSYSTDTMPRELIEKLRLRGVRKVQFLFENAVPGEPFALYEAAADYIEHR